MLAAFGADVMLVNSPNLPNIPAIANTSPGKRSAHLDLLTDDGYVTLWRLIDEVHVFSQGYRPGGIAALGFGPDTLAARWPGIVYASLTAYGTQGPWAQRRGFDSLVQTAMGFKEAEAQAFGEDKPHPLPMQMLDHGKRFSDGVRGIGGTVEAAARRQKLACAGVARADGALAARIGPRRGWRACREAGVRALSRA